MIRRDFTDSMAGNSAVGEGVTEEVALIVSAALMHIPFEGWSDEALIAGAVDAGIEPDRVSVCFPSGPIDAILAYTAIADSDMVAAFEALSDMPDKVHLRIRTLILVRLEQAAAHKEAVRRALTLLALPINTGHSARTLYRTVDAMWRAAGQKDTDFSFYTKRVTLAAVYSATLLAWMADPSSDMAATEAFLDRRLREVARIPQMTRPAQSIFAAGQKLAEDIAGGMGRRTGR